MIGEVALANFELPEFMVPAIEPIRALFEGGARHIKGEMAERNMERKEWILVQCFDPFRDAQGNPGEHKEPVPDLDTPMTKQAALKALQEIEAQRPGEDFSIRRIGPVIKLNH